METRQFAAEGLGGAFVCSWSTAQGDVYFASSRREVLPRDWQNHYEMASRIVKLYDCGAGRSAGKDVDEPVTRIVSDIHSQARRTATASKSPHSPLVNFSCSVKPIIFGAPAPKSLSAVDGLVLEPCIFVSPAPNDVPDHALSPSGPLSAEKSDQYGTESGCQTGSKTLPNAGLDTRAPRKGRGVPPK